MRILFCNYEYPPLGGGGGVVMAALARELAKRHAVTVLTSRAGELSAESDDRGVRVDPRAGAVPAPALGREFSVDARLPADGSLARRADAPELRVSTS